VEFDRREIILAGEAYFRRQSHLEFFRY
jgi:hypothetical protein